MTDTKAKKRTWDLLTLLSDGKFHSGEFLAKELDISRASIFKVIEEVTKSGINLERVRGKGYRLTHHWSPIKYDEIQKWLGNEANNFSIEILEETGSSNTTLTKLAAMGAKSGTVLVVEMQSSGRGRFGRAWHSNLGSSLTFSILWRFEAGLSALSGLSLAVGVAIVRSLRKLSAQDVYLKWPNDIISTVGKLGGVLIEAEGDFYGPSSVVIGIGLNCALPINLEQKIDQPASSLKEICLLTPSREQLLATLLQEINSALKQFEVNKLSTLRFEWEKYNAYQNRDIKITLPDGSRIKGLMRGINDQGELCLETEKDIRYINSGEIGS